MNWSNRAQRNILSAILLAIFLILQLPFFHWIPDDAFISFRYSSNLASGKGLVFNAGEKVEGFSNPLWTLFLAGAARIGLDIVNTAVIVSTIMGFISLILLFKLLRFVASCCFKDSLASLEFAFMSAGAAFFPLVFYTSSGMESTTYLALILAGAILNLRGTLARRECFLILSSLLFLFASLMRPEGILFLLVNLAFIARQRKNFSKRILYASTFPLLIYIGFHTASFIYFGHVLPNTFYAKPGASVNYLEPIAKGFSYLIHFFIKSGLVALIPFALAPSNGQDSKYIRAYSLSLVLAQLGFIIYVGADVLRFDRFSLPFFPFLLVLGFMGFARIMGRNGNRFRLAALRTAIMCILFVCTLNISRAFFIQSNPCKHDWMHGGTLKRIGMMLEKALPGRSIIVTNEIGAISYYSGKTLIDMLGLTDMTISRIRYASFQEFGLGSSAESVVKVANYILGRKPQCIILPSYASLKYVNPSAPGSGMHPLWFAIFSHRDFTANYQRITSLKVNDAKFINIFVRSGTSFIPTYLQELHHWRCLERTE